MSHFAKIDEGVVTQVIVAEQAVVDAMPGEWLQTSYNTHGGVHTLGGTPLRKNFAGLGFTYDPDRDAFIPPQPFASWRLDEETCLWRAPVTMPDDGRMLVWNEPTLSWAEAD